jgi:hypothetical protein
MENTVIKVLTKEHGKRVINWFKSQGIDTGSCTGTICESEGFNCIYYGVINGNFINYYIEQVLKNNAKIIELPEDEFDMTTTEGRLAYAKKHYPVGTKYKSLYSGQELIVGSYDGYLCLQPEGAWSVYDFLTNKWAEIIEEKQEEIVMETQKLTRQGLKEIHSVACSEWKNTLEEWGKNNPLEDYIELTQSKVDNMFKSCTSEQLPIVSKYLKQDDGSVDLSKITGAFRDENDEVMIARRMEKEYANKSFWLNSSYNWEIKKDTDNILCLIPTKKK